MTRVFILWLLLASTMGWGVYELKYRVVRMDEALAKLNREIISDQESIRILHAEWSYLNQPHQIETLAGKYLTLQPIRPKQMIAMADLPTRAESDATPPAVLAKGTIGPRRTPAIDPAVAAPLTVLRPKAIPVADKPRAPTATIQPVRSPDPRTPAARVVTP